MQEQRFDVGSHVQVVRGRYDGHAGRVFRAEWVEVKCAAGWVYHIKLDEPIDCGGGRCMDRLVMNEHELGRG